MTPPSLTSHPANNQHFFRADVSHGTLRDFHQHGEDRFLQGKAQVGWGVATTMHHFFNVRQNAREGDVHALHHVRQLNEIRATKRERGMVSVVNNIPNETHFRAMSSMLYPGLGSFERWRMRAKRSRQLPTAISMVSPKMRYLHKHHEFVCYVK